MSVLLPTLDPCPCCQNKFSHLLELELAQAVKLRFSSLKRLQPHTVHTLREYILHVLRRFDGVERDSCLKEYVLYEAIFGFTFGAQKNETGTRKMAIGAEHHNLPNATPQNSSQASIIS